MQSCVAYRGKLRVHRALAVVLLASAAAACGSDSSRFADNPFTNPFASAATQKVDRTTTQSIPSRAAPAGAVASQPLPPMISSVPASGAVAATQRPVARVASATLQNATPIAGSAAGWSATGGTPVTVGAGDTASSLSARYGVPVAAINAANGGGIRPGQSAIIPIYTGAAAAPSRPGLMAPVVAAPVATVPAPRPPQPVATALPPERPTASRPQVAAVKPAKAASPKAANDNSDDAKPTGRIVPAGAPKTTSAKPADAKSAQSRLIAAAKPLKPATPAKPEADDDEDEEDDKPAARKAEIKPAEAKPAQPKVAAVDPKKNVRMIPLTPQKPETVAEAPKAADPVTTQSITT
jgi:LysM repeat protein